MEIYEEDEASEEFQELLRQVDEEHRNEAVLNIGGVTLSQQEEDLMKLPPGMAMDPKLTETEFDCSSEESYAKLRMELRKWEEHNLDHEEDLEN